MNIDPRFAEYFLFTQHSLATFDNCPLKFKKRYMENLKWDTFPDEKVKKRLEMGNNFHLLANRYFLGTDPGLDEFTEEYESLSTWLENLKNSFKFEEGVRYLPEYKLRMVRGELKLEANFDLIMIRDESIEIWDWKTHEKDSKNRRVDLQRKLLESLQTKVYMFVLKEQAAFILGKEIDCSRITMNYWQPDPPGILVSVNYTEGLHEQFGNTIKTKIKNILNYDFTDFDKNTFSRHCKFCEFNWFCNNERVDFKSIEENDDFLDDLDFDSVGEIY